MDEMGFLGKLLLPDTSRLAAYTHRGKDSACVGKIIMSELVSLLR